MAARGRHDVGGHRYRKDGRIDPRSKIPLVEKASHMHRVDEIGGKSHHHRGTISIAIGIVQEQTQVLVGELGPDGVTRNHIGHHQHVVCEQAMVGQRHIVDVVVLVHDKVDILPW